ncbi:putative nop14-like family protein [Coleophoma crateriformis]|uniref:Putative nop14-like family protein n=1 Tax=Coleophoma crateriformis TaxID=565419 RepID=A0A3D8RJF7_9HELO|nr:putative nop14-like family protein [Coleophoma crateriformis]
MPPSQLKRLKASLREQGIVGPQKSKKQKKQNAQNGVNNEKRVQRNVALTGIREQFNPFEVKTSARGPKFDVTSNKTISGRVTKGVKGRPGVTKGLGEENRRKTLLVEMQRRNKVGGILDKRFGENDPSMAPEDKMMERFTQEKLRRHKTSSAFDLEDDEEAGELTHMGQSLSLDGPNIQDDFDDEGLELSDAEDHPSDEERQRKRRRSGGSDDSGPEGSKDEEDRPERKKSKQEVMKELIAKSKMHKYERQAAKDDDEDLREELDKEMPNLHELLRGIAPRPAPAPLAAASGMNPDRAALLSGTDKIKFDKEYDLRLRQMAQDKRSAPTERTKTEDEKMEEEARKLQELEAKRLRRMQGAPESSDEEEEPAAAEEDEEEDDFGFGSGIKTRPTMAELGIDDEDDFIIDDDLVASGSELEPSDDEDSESENEADDGEDAEFLKGLLTEEEAKRPEFLTGANAPIQETPLPANNGVNGDLAYTFKCPESHEELLDVMKKVDILDFPLAIQRIRALYHPKLKSENKAKLGHFAVSLVDHISYLANQPKQSPFSILETIIRHIHSLAKTYPAEIANAFRRHLEEIHNSRALAPTPGDLVLLTAVGSIFPTSDHFHQVVTPAILTMTRYIGQKIPQELSDYAIGAYLSILCLQYQRLSKRYIPELVSFIQNTLCVLAPTKPTKISGDFPYHEPKTNIRIVGGTKATRKLSLSDCISTDRSEAQTEALKIAILDTTVQILDAAADTWTGKPAFVEVFEPTQKTLQHLATRNNRSKLHADVQAKITKVSQKLERLLKHAHLACRPLELHHHKPLAIKTSIPKFEDSYNPDKHYDPDRERAEASKLKAEHKRERKGAMRELRKDANFIARESLREKKERDAAYEKKYKRLVAEIQGEEGREAKEYEREKEWRKKGKK